MNASHLFGTRRFLPLFLTQLLGALNDNLFKNALVLLVTFRAADAVAKDGGSFAALAGGVFILPYFLFSATAGKLADRLDKGRMIRWLKGIELLCTIPFAIALTSSNGTVLLAAIFVAGTLATFFGPPKYSILPQHLDATELGAGNAFVETATFLAILAGTIGAGIAVSLQAGVAVCAGGLLVIAVAGFLASLFIPAAPASGDPASYPTLRLNVLADTRELLLEAKREHNLFLVLLGLSWFWFLGATFIAELPALSRDVFGGAPSVCTLLLAAFAVGIGAGSIACAKVMGGKIHARPVPLAALAMSAAGIDFHAAAISFRAPEAGAAPIGPLDFLSTFAGWHILFDLAALAAAGGFFCVPLYSLMQSLPAPSARARAVAACNVLNAAFMVASAGIAVALLALGRSIPWILLSVSLANLVVAAYAVLLLPDALLKQMLALVFRLAFRVRVHGLENYPVREDKALIVPNHQSFLDAALLAAFLPGRPTFAVDTEMAKKWWVRPFLRLVNAFPIDPTTPLGLKSLIKAVDEGRHTVIFPEGRLTVTGSLMKIYEGPGLVADKTGALLVPVRIDGAQYTYFSRLKGKVRQRLFPRIEIDILPPRELGVPAGVTGRERRHAAGESLADLMTSLVFETTATNMSLFGALLDARLVHGAGAPVVQDLSPKTLSYRQLIRASFSLGRPLGRLAGRGQPIGVLLPNSAGTAAVFWALQSQGRVAALLNFSAGAKALVAALAAGLIRKIVTSRRFIAAAKLEETIEALKEAGAEIVFLEDIAGALRFLDKAFGFLGGTRLGRLLHRRARVRPDETAVILFTSGSEGTPKGVVLSHRNLLANRAQMAAIIDVNARDIVFNALPLFHSFGLTAGLLLPTLAGVKTVLYPSPLHYRVVPELVYATNATILFGTDTFLAGYAKNAHPYDFRSVRHVFAGAERVKESTRAIFFQKFGLRVLEGYGATECAPVIAVNTPMHFREGTVGRLVPGLEARLATIPGIERGGRLFVRGPNVMLGYFKPERPGVLEPPVDGWYDTGDIVEIDEAGFVTILGRAKRFAKLAGEMVSLGAVEDLVQRVWPERGAIAVALPDAKKGEQIIVLVEAKTEAEAATIDRAALLERAKADGVPELFVPKTVLAVPALPLLASGKADFAAAKSLAEAQLAGSRVLEEDAVEA